MTEKEAIKILQDEKCHEANGYITEALQIAIKAIEAKDKLIKDLGEAYVYYTDNPLRIGLEVAIDIVREAYGIGELE